MVFSMLFQTEAERAGYSATGVIDNVSVRAQNQTLTSNTFDTFFIRNKVSGLYLSIENDTDLMQVAYDGEDNQKWQIVENPNLTVSLINLSENTPGYGLDCYAIEAVSNSEAEISVRAQADNYNPVYEYEQGFFMSTDNGFTTFMNREYLFSYLAADPLYSSSVIMASDSDYAEWSLIPCGNPYVLPEILNGSFYTDKYNATGSNGLLNKMNCYAYALGMYSDYCYGSNDPSYANLQPGYISLLSFDYGTLLDYSVYDPVTGNFVLDSDGIGLWVDYLIDALEADLCSFYNDGIQSQTRVRASSYAEKMCGPWKKIALVLDTESDLFGGEFYDYHWYVEHKDGCWSHKRGLSEASILDSSNQIIQNPALAGRTYGNGQSYNCFVGYFKIKMDSVPNYISDDSPIFRNHDNFGETPAMANNLGVISLSYSFSPTTVTGRIEHVSPYDTQYANSGLPGNGPARDFSWNSDAEWFEMMVYTAGTYHIYSEGDGDLFVSVYAGDTLIATDDGSGSNTNFYIEVYMLPNYLYRVCVCGHSNGTGYGDYLICFY